MFKNLKYKCGAIVFVRLFICSVVAAVVILTGFPDIFGARIKMFEKS